MHIELVTNMKNTNKICLITRANGYVGQYLSAYFGSMGWNVIKLVRVPNKTQKKDIQFSFGQSINLSEYPSADLLIHVAYDFTDHKKNVDGATNLINEARSVGIKKLLHISSVSAYEGCLSEYGKTKLQIENLFLENDGINIRSGLIYGENTKGILGEIKNKLKSSFLIPVIGGGKYPIYLTYLR